MVAESAVFISVKTIPNTMAVTRINVTTHMAAIRRVDITGPSEFLTSSHPTIASKSDIEKLQRWPISRSYVLTDAQKKMPIAMGLDVTDVTVIYDQGYSKQ